MIVIQPLNHQFFADWIFQSLGQIDSWTTTFSRDAHSAWTSPTLSFGINVLDKQYLDRVW